jgi:hypothetical protein
MNIRLYASDVGNLLATPFTIPWCLCWNIAVVVGPINNCPTSHNSSAIPSTIAVACIGVDNSTRLKVPMIESYSSAGITANVAVTMSSVEWNGRRLKNPIVLITV